MSYFKTILVFTINNEHMTIISFEEFFITDFFLIFILKQLPFANKGSKTTFKIYPSARYRTFVRISMVIFLFLYIINMHLHTNIKIMVMRFLLPKMSTTSVLFGDRFTMQTSRSKSSNVRFMLHIWRAVDRIFRFALNNLRFLQIDP